MTTATIASRPVAAAAPKAPITLDAARRRFVTTVENTDGYSIVEGMSLVTALLFATQFLAAAFGANLGIF